LVGITGTNGKTTVGHLIHEMLNDVGIRCGLTGTVQVDDGADTRPAALTTPPAVEISRLLRAMVDHGCAAAVLEVSSHALHQRRTAGISFDAAVFTNLSGDHLDYHRTVAAYAETKATLFRTLAPTAAAIVNIDAPAAGRMLRGCRGRVLTCSLRAPGADCYAEVGRQTTRTTEVVFTGPWGSFDAQLPLTGRHNVTNALQAAAVCSWLGVQRADLPLLLERCTAPPGRLEPLTGPHDEFAVLVDYAHTDDALASALEALRDLPPDELGPRGRLRVVFGCGGDRDRTKRPRMARVAARFADELIITSDNPRTEDPQAIIDDIVAGIPFDRLADTLTLVDRRQAIEAAIERTEPGDVVLIAGKGHEPYQIIGTRRRPFDDRRVAARALARHRAQATA
jgi:UDP-N-acetylmuramoyl-L-alanyl-D-glutamate--2,6-diaminopimelate ligase